MQDISEIRKNIDKIDAQLAELLQKRALEIAKIKEFKQKFKIATQDPSREKEIIDKLDSEFEKEVFKKILEESRKLQNTSLT